MASSPTLTQSANHGPRHGHWAGVQHTDFFEFGAKVISGAIEAYGSPSGLAADNRSSELVVTEMQRLALTLHLPNDLNLTGNEKALCKLADECVDISTRIIALIEKAKLKNRKSKINAFLAGARSRWYEGERQQLERRLTDCRGQLALQIDVLARFVALPILLRREGSDANPRCPVLISRPVWAPSSPPPKVIPTSY